MKTIMFVDGPGIMLCLVHVIAGDLASILSLGWKKEEEKGLIIV